MSYEEVGNYIWYGIYLSIIPLAIVGIIKLNSFIESEKKHIEKFKKITDEKKEIINEHILYKRMINNNRVIILKDRPRN